MERISILGEIILVIILITIITLCCFAVKVIVDAVDKQGKQEVKTPEVNYKRFSILPLPVSDECNSSDENKKMYLCKVTDGDTTAYKLFIDIKEEDKSLVLQGNDVEIVITTSDESPYIEFFKDEHSYIIIYDRMPYFTNTSYNHYVIHIPQDSIMEYNY